MSLPIVAIIGRPNVGKSTLVNRLAGARESIVHDEPGVTRDRTYRRAFWRDREFVVVDTGPVGRCQAYALDTKVRIRVQDEERYFYPDSFVTCSDLDNDHYASDQPVLVVEVISPSTEDFDRGPKFEAYRQLAALHVLELIRHFSERG